MLVIALKRSMSSKSHETTSVIAGLLYNFTNVKMKRPNKTY